MHALTAAPDTAEMRTLQSFIGSLDRRIDTSKMLQAMAWTIQAMSPADQSEDRAESWHWVRLSGTGWMPAKRVGEFWHSVGLAAPAAMVTVGPVIDCQFGHQAPREIPSEESPFALVESLHRLSGSLAAMRRELSELSSPAHLLRGGVA